MGCNNSRGRAARSKVEAEAAAEAKRPREPRRRAATPETPAAFYAAMKPLEPGGAAPFRFLKGSWIREHAKKIRKAKEDGDKAALKSLAIKYRQKMPEEAFMTVEEVEKQRETIEYGFARIKRLAAAAVSYCWETREHPTPSATRSSPSPTRSKSATRRSEKGEFNYSKIPRTSQYFGITRVFFSTRRAASAPRSRIGSSRCAPHRHCCCCRAALTRFTSFRHTHTQFGLDNLDLVYAHEGTTIFRLLDSAPPTRPSYSARWDDTHLRTGPAMNRVRAPPLSLSQARMPRLSLYPLSFTASPHRRVAHPQGAILVPVAGRDRRGRIGRERWEGASAADDRRVPREGEDASLYKRSRQAGGRRVVREDAACGARRLEGADLHESRLGRCGGRAFAESLPLVHAARRLNVSKQDWQRALTARRGRWPTARRLSSQLNLDGNEIGNEGLTALDRALTAGA